MTASRLENRNQIDLPLQRQSAREKGAQMFASPMPWATRRAPPSELRKPLGIQASLPAAQVRAGQRRAETVPGEIAGVCPKYFFLDVKPVAELHAGTCRFGSPRQIMPEHDLHANLTKPKLQETVSGTYIVCRCFAVGCQRAGTSERVEFRSYLRAVEMRHAEIRKAESLAFEFDGYEALGVWLHRLRATLPDGPCILVAAVLRTPDSTGSIPPGSVCRQS